MKSLSIFGAGKLGQTLGQLWHRHQQFTIQQVVCQSLDSAEHAVAFIGAGQAATPTTELARADVWLIATPDGAIEAAARALRSKQLLDDNTVIAHCSGALASDVLCETDSATTATTTTTTTTASIHPIHSFANPTHSVANFSGSFCAYEGGPLALAVLLPAFERIGAQLFAVRPTEKTLYHAASVMACNYLVALLDASLECFEAAGINRTLGQKLLLPIAHQTIDNTLQHSPESALTGPISRGDIDTVTKQLDQLQQQHPHLAPIYRTLGLHALDIAERQHSDKARSLDAIKTVLKKP